MRIGVISFRFLRLWRPGLRHLRASAAAAIAASMLAMPIAHAQQAVPSSAPPLPQGGTDPERRIRPEPSVHPAPAAPAVVPEPAPAAPAIAGSFVVSAIVIDGATVFDSTAFVPLYRDLLARPVTQRDLAALAEAITNMYYDAGYTLSRAYIPPQDIEAGVIHVRVAEGYIERVTINGDADRAPIVRRYAEAVTAERPLRRETLERQLLLLTDLFGLRVDDARLRPVDAGTGQYELILDLHLKSFDSYSYLDNRGTRSNGPLELWSSAGVNVLDAGAWRAQGAIFTAPESPQELLYLQAGLSHVVDDEGTLLRMTLSGSRNVAGPPQNRQDTETSSRRVLFDVTHPFLRSRSHSLWGSLYLDALQSTEDQFKQSLFRDELRVVRASFYDYVADGWGGENGINLEGSIGLPVLGASSSGPERSRTDANASFRKVRLDAWRNQSVYGPVSLYGQFAGQLSDRPLLSSEEFTLGGARFGRAYDPAIVSGDRGAAGSVELRFTEPLEGTFREYQLYGFYDAGGISNGTVDNNTRHRLASTGLGGRLTMQPDIRLNLELDKPLTSVEGREAQDWRTFFFISAAF